MKKPIPKKCTLLVVDDEAEMVSILKLSFEEEGFTVITASNGPAAIALAKSSRPDLMILDVKMPGMSGIDVCHAIRQDPNLTTTPVIMLTAKRLDEGLESALQVKANWYLEKPFDFVDLLFHVKALLHQGPPSAEVRIKGEHLL